MAVYNFSAGPAILPAAVLAKAKEELQDYRGTGMSIMEVSHRSSIFQEVIDQAESRLRELMQIPKEYAVLFTQGGAWSQFSAVPLNLLNGSKKADYIDTGSWASKAAKEAARFGEARVVSSSKEDGYTTIPDVHASDFDIEADYIHLTTNNTIYGTTYPQLPYTRGIPLVADMSSNILSEPYNIRDFGLVYAGAQKNIGPAGLTLVIVRKDLIGKAQDSCPTMLNYATLAEKGSMFNTPPTFAIYLAGLVFDWIKEEGGVSAMGRRNRNKARLLYDYLDQSDLFSALVDYPFRSIMNITFKVGSEELEKKFIQQSDEAGFKFLKGHRSVGGLRASLYNAMPLEGVEALVSFMAEFERRG